MPPLPFEVRERILPEVREFAVIALAVVVVPVNVCVEVPVPEAIVKF